MGAMDRCRLERLAAVLRPARYNYQLDRRRIMGRAILGVIAGKSKRPAMPSPALDRNRLVRCAGRRLDGDRVVLADHFVPIRD